MSARRFWTNCTATVVVVLLTAAIIVGCYTVPETGRRAVNFIPERQELSLGASAYQEARTQTQISTNPQYNAQIRRVGQRISSSANRDYYDWEFTVFEEPDTINAWCLPGGKIGFYTGIMPVCASDDGVAVVMGHEVGHAVARHGGERMSIGLVVLAGQAAVAYAAKDEETKNQQMIMAAYGIGTTLFVQLPYSRKHEYEADYIGLMMMADAGYDPRESVYFWRRMKAIGEARGGKPPEFLSTHPSDEHRIAQLEQYMPEALERYYNATGLTPPPGTAFRAPRSTRAAGLASAPILRTGGGQ